MEKVKDGLFWATHNDSGSFSWGRILGVMSISAFYVGLFVFNIVTS